VADVEVVSSKSREEFFSDLSGKYKNIDAVYRTSASGAVGQISPFLNGYMLIFSQIAGNFDKEFVSRLPPSLKYICHNGAGYDQIDVAACTERHITVTYAPDPVTAATADLTMFLLLGAIRQLNAGIEAIHAGKFKQGVGFGHDPQGKVLGILGMGRIGKAVVERARPFGLMPVYHNRKPLPTGQAGGASYVSLDELLSKSDIISIHVPLSASTRHLIGKKEISQMKPGVVIVNTARGAIIDEAAMAEALKENHIGAVGLDVYEKEPIVHEGLLNNERALLIPHLGTHTTETLAKMEACAMENARRGVCGEKLLTVVPEQCS
jgi:lactate dehydrogenase-like 2-hydroxyacid dehydrogenase